ncbi:MAG: hypothetical protein OXU20_13110 [Myxococcales bacterium]|nr:hypothetical protein [Myxococcales bacterium]
MPSTRAVVYDTPELEAFWTQHATVMEAWVGAMQLKVTHGGSRQLTPPIAW